MQKEDLKSTAINIGLIVFGILLQIIGFLFSDGLITDKVLNAALIVGLIAGIMYVRGGYRKNAAIYYKTFLIIYAAEVLYSVIAEVFRILASFSAFSTAQKVFAIAAVVLRAGAAVCILILAFRKDLMKKKSMLLATTHLMTVWVATILEIIAFRDFSQYYSIYLGGLLLSVLAYRFVVDKYADKDARGAK